MIPPIESLDKVGLDCWLSRFILEVEKKGDPTSEFLPNTLCHICHGIQHYLRCDGKRLVVFSAFKHSLDAEMKRLQSSGIGSKQNKLNHSPV